MTSGGRLRRARRVDAPLSCGSGLATSVSTRAEIGRLAGIYDVTELATAVKPLLLRRLLDDSGREVIYLDPDIRIFASLQPVADLAAAHGIVLTPHTTRPYPDDEREIDAFFVLAVGVYNLGFIAVGGNRRARFWTGGGSERDVRRWSTFRE